MCCLNLEKQRTPYEARGVVDEVRAAHGAYAGAIPREALENVFQRALAVVCEVAEVWLLGIEYLHRVWCIQALTAAGGSCASCTAVQLTGSRVLVIGLSLGPEAGSATSGMCISTAMRK